MNNTNNNTFEVLDELLTITDSIKTIYQKLYEMEIGNHQEEASYYQYLDYLNIALEVEHSLYQTLSNEDRQMLLEYLKEDSYDYFDSLVKMDWGEETNRIINRLMYQLTNSTSYLNELSLYEICDVPNLMEYVKESFQEAQLFNKACYEEFLWNYLALLKQNGDANLVSQAKYFASFMEPFLEHELVSNRFLLWDNLCLNTKVMAVMLNFDDDLYQFLKTSYGKRKAVDYILKILNITDSDLQTKENKALMTLYSLFLQSSFLMLDDKTLKDLRNYYHEFIDSSEYQEQSLNNHVGEQLVVTCFVNALNNKKIDKVLSLS